MKGLQNPRRGARQRCRAAALGLVAACFVAGPAGCGGGGGGSTAPATTAGAAETTAGSSSTTPGAGGSEGAGVKSISDYGDAAGGAERREAESAARSYFAAFAARDYARVCAGLSATNREALQGSGKSSPQAGKGCAAVLKTLIGHTSILAAGRSAADGNMEGVRVKGDTAFVLFRPAGGEPSYFALKREGGAWKAISLAPGAPLDVPAR